MASGFNIDEKDRVPYELSVNDPKIDADEKQLRDVITKWARKQEPGAAAWIYSWNASWNQSGETTE